MGAVAGKGGATTAGEVGIGGVVGEDAEGDGVAAVGGHERRRPGARRCEHGQAWRRSLRAGRYLRRVWGGGGGGSGWRGSFGKLCLDSRMVELG